MTRVESILEYKKNNPGCDPNLYELVEILNEMAEKISKGTISKSESEKYDEVYNINLCALLNNDLGVNEGSPLYRIILKAKQNSQKGIISPSYYAKLAGVSLYILQQKRAVKRGEQTNVVFDNKCEIDFLRRELSAVRKKKIQQGARGIDALPEFKLYGIAFDFYMSSVSWEEDKYDK